MGFSTTRTPLSPSPFPFFINQEIRIPTNPSFLHFHPSKPISRNSRSCLTIDRHSVMQSSSVSQRVRNLDFEFKSLSEPIERVKRLLQYATILPPFDESSRIQENRVFGCTTQVWLEVNMDRNGVMRFRLDSDSEITKGFCSCLILLLDGAEADEVLSVKTDDLIELNVGLPSRGNSRVNTWHNVLISMQRRTKSLVDER
ncbi:hypothetical protein ACS0TY_009093 [Phlomoides rotata]